MHDRRCFPVKTNKNIKKIHWPRGKFYGNALARNVLMFVLTQRGPTTGPRNNFVRPAEQFCTIKVLSIISSGNLL